VSFICCWHWNK